MEKNFVSTGNKLIADFMEWRPIVCSNPKDHYYIPDSFELIIEEETTHESNWGWFLIQQDECSIKDMKFNTSWDWIMPVVEKIESLGYDTSFKTNYVRINPKENCSYYNYISMVCFNSEGWYLNHPYVSYDDNPDFAPIERGENQLTKLEAIYRVVIEFIKWYNNEKS